MYHVKPQYKPLLWIVDALGRILFVKKRAIPFPEDPKRILIIRLDHLGDMVLTSPFLRNLRQKYPRSQITVLCRSLTVPIAESIPYIDEIEVLDVPWFRGKAVSWKEVRKWTKAHKKKYDVVFDLHADPRNIWIASQIGKYTVGYSIRGAGFLLDRAVPYPDNSVHQVDRSMMMLKDVGIGVHSNRIELAVDTKSLAKVRKLLRSKDISARTSILLNPGSGTPHKEWDRFPEVVALLLKHTDRNIILVDKDDRRIKSILEKNRSARVISFAGELNIKEVIALTSQVPFYIGCDSMGAHIASAFNVKILAIFGSQNYASMWKPYGKHVVVLQRGPIDPYYSLDRCKQLINSITPQEVLKEFKKL